MSRIRSTLDALRDKRIAAVLFTPEYRTLLAEATTVIRSGCASTPNEASTAAVFELELYSHIRDTLGLRFVPEKEVVLNGVRHTARGRLDARVGALVVEYKHHTALATTKQQDKATQQLREYLETLERQDPDTEFVGVLTDGVKCAFIQYRDHDWNAETVRELTPSDLDAIVRVVIQLDSPALNARNLVKDFDAHDPRGITMELFGSLDDYITGKSDPRTEMLFLEWQELFRLAHEDKSKQRAIIERRTALEGVAGRELATPDEQYRVLFSLQTTYAIIVKAIAFKVVSNLHSPGSVPGFESALAAGDATVRLQMESLEDGGLFRQFGIGNLLEGDFFSWYSSKAVWNAQLSGAVRRVLGAVTRYEDITVLRTGLGVEDLFRDLYENIMPAKVRHSLGEYYTPMWLADHVVETALSKTKAVGWRGLDPCCGSGTFLRVMISRVLSEVSASTPAEQLNAVTSRVVGIDLNPLAALTARVNYFTSVAHLLDGKSTLDIPVYLGDSADVPAETDVGSAVCVTYTIQTLREDIDVVLPLSAMEDQARFSTAMTELETDIKTLDTQAVYERLYQLIEGEDRIPEVTDAVKGMATQLVSLEKQGWNGIWARIITNFLTTANLGRFDVIVGNPPWVDWKNLPSAYRERIKEVCATKRLFSGDRLTGGINLNICALIADVAADRWLATDGAMALLMPKSLVFQQTYEGFRQLPLEGGGRLYFESFVDWSAAGKIFGSSGEKCLTFVVTSKVQDYAAGVPCTRYTRNKGAVVRPDSTQFSAVAAQFSVQDGLLGQCRADSTGFTYAATNAELGLFARVAGDCEYTGREGVEFYPQELMLLVPQKVTPPASGTMWFENFQNPKSKHRVPKKRLLLETKYLRPLIKGVDIEPFFVNPSAFVVPFPYDRGARTPISMRRLADESPLLRKYFVDHKSVFDIQTDYNDRIVGDSSAEFYALARVGAYSYAQHYVCFRDNTAWGAAVVGPTRTPWGETMVPAFQNHAVSISESRTGRFITEDEAHYICAILNAPVVGRFLLNSSDHRTFKIRPPVAVVEYDAGNPVHARLSQLSRLAHERTASGKSIQEILSQIEDQFQLLLSIA